MAEKERKNLTDEALADAIGYLDAEIKVRQKQLTALKDGVKERGDCVLAGNSFEVTITTSDRETFDTDLAKEKLQKALGEKRFKREYFKKSSTTRTTIKFIGKKHDEDG